MPLSATVNKTISVKVTTKVWRLQHKDEWQNRINRHMTAPLEALSAVLDDNDNQNFLFFLFFHKFQKVNEDA